jgi:imidazole glycerol-phosphate synthase subunit HisF
MDVIPALDLLQGNAVRLRQGNFNLLTNYGDPEGVLDSLEVPPGSRLHVVDLEASRSGRPVETEIVRRLAQRDLRVQVGGGIRSVADARRWIDCGAAKVVVGTVAADAPAVLRAIAGDVGAARVVAAVDMREGVVRVAGWERDAQRSLAEILDGVAEACIEEVLVTDIASDGEMSGPSFATYRALRSNGLRVIASGGVTTVSDVVSLARIPGVGGCVIGRALLDGRISLAEARARVTTPNAIPERVIPCLDVRDGRVVKGVNFANIRDAGDPVECAVRYEAEGADELVILDISATDRGRDTAHETVRRVADALFIPLIVGGGVRTIEDFRALLRAGADRVAINTAAVRDPQLIAGCAREFGVQAVVLSCDARGGEVMVRSGKEPAGLDAVEWCRHAESLGAGEILLTAVDRDGTNSGFDIPLLRAVSSALKIGVIASGGAGALEHFRDAIESGGARAVLAASLFHDRRLTIGQVKEFLAKEGIPVRAVSCQA